MAYNNGLCWLIYGLVWSMVAYCFRLLGVPGRLKLWPKFGPYSGFYSRIQAAGWVWAVYGRNNSHAELAPEGVCFPGSSSRPPGELSRRRLTGTSPTGT